MKNACIAIAGRLERCGEPQRHADRHEQHGEVEGSAARFLLLRVASRLDGSGGTAAEEVRAWA